MEQGPRGGDLLDMALGLPWSDAVAFPADPSSATDARHFVANVLRSAGANYDVIDNVELVVSELVTNAILHAATGPTVTLSLTRNSIRVEVRDASTTIPSLPHFGSDAATGRGLSVVSRAARDWGIDTDQFGKTVWAEFATTPPLNIPEGQPPRISSELIVDSQIAEPTKLIRFNAVPVALYMELEQNNDATLREFELLSIELENENESIRNIHHQLASLVVRSTAYLNPVKNRLRNMVQRAERRGLERVDLKVHADVNGVTYALEFASLMAEADAMSERGVLLTAPAPEAVRQLRYWFVEEMQKQFTTGRPPIAFKVHG